VLTGTERMKERPIQDLLDALNQMNVSARALNNNGCPPIEIRGGNLLGGSVNIRCAISSQYLSGLLLIGSCTKKGLEIRVSEGPVSKPYIDMTLDVMNRFGVHADRRGYEWFFVPGGQVYRSGAFTVEPDASNASYFWAAAAVSCGTVTVKGIDGNSRQGDLRFTECLEKMGCRVIRKSDSIAVTGNDLSGIEVDMADMPDMVPTLAVVAAFAKGTTRINNVAHLRAKESDRLMAVATELIKMGIHAVVTESGLIIHGGNPHGAEIHTYEDHRIAMSFAVTGLRTEGVIILDEACVGKSFPNFWDVFNQLYEK
jgi:3-phosphoshikimate 1-carboxyvinyltransferase